MDKKDLQSLQEAGSVAARLHTEIGRMIKPGVNLLEIEELAVNRIKEAGMKPAFQGYKGYRYATCLSVNEEIVHGLPHDYTLETGDIISVDLGVKKDGMMVDTARTHAVGKISHTLSNLLAVTQTALHEALPLCRAGNTTGDIGAIIEKTVKEGSCAVIPELTGHGVGKTLQEPPSIPNHGRPGTGTTLKEGMVLAIEPITCLEKTDIAILADGWTIIARNGLPCAHFEDTVVITDGTPLVLTREA